MEGQTAFFHCVMKFPDASVATWFKDGVQLQDMQELFRRSYMGPDGSLSIDPTMMSDLGEYVCNVRNNEGEVQTAKAFLNIQCRLLNSKHREYPLCHSTKMAHARYRKGLTFLVSATSCVSIDVSTSLSIYLFVMEI